jgi:opacity protein-like surface antigen
MGTIGSMKAAGVAVVAMIWALSPGAVRAAQPSPSYWMAELDLGWGVGAAFPDSPGGLKTGVALGVGGSPGVSPLRFHLMLHLDFQELSADGLSRLEPTWIERSLVQATVGMRLGAMLSSRARGYVELGLGHLFVATRAELGGGAERFEQSDDSFVLQFAVGAQYRLHHHFSLGLRMDMSIPTGLMAFDPLAEMAGADGNDGGAVNFDWALTTTFHF